MLLVRVGRPVFFAEDGLNFFIEILTAVTDEEDLECLFNCNPSLEVLVIHQEGDKVVKLAWLKIGEISDASLVHRFEL